MAAAAAGHPGGLHHALQSPPNSNAAAINPAGGFLFLPQNPTAGIQGQQMHPGKNKELIFIWYFLRSGGGALRVSGPF